MHILFFFLYKRSLHLNEYLLNCIPPGIRCAKMDVAHNGFHFYYPFVQTILPIYIFIDWNNSMSKKENEFQSKLKKELKARYDGCIVTKLDANDIQGIPDLLILYKNKWATLENKKDAKATKQPNQDYYVDKMNNMSFSRFIYPENKKEVLNELDEFFH